MYILNELKHYLKTISEKLQTELMLFTTNQKDENERKRKKIETWFFFL